MSTAATEVATTRRVPPFAAAAVISVAVVVFVLHCAASALGRGYWFDEVYMLAIGRYHLDWGSADQPPLAPALAALMHTVAPAARPALAFPAALATGCAVVLAGLIAREFGCDRCAQVVTALAQATGLWTSLAGHWLTPYALEPAQWMLLMWLLIRWVRLRDDRLLIAFGCVAGIAALTKLQVILLSSVLLVAVALVGPRELLRRPMLWFGGAIAAVIALPTLVWQQVHGWPQLQMASVVGGEAEALYGGRGGIAVQLILFAGVLGVALVVYGLWRLLRDDEMREYRFVAVAFVFLYVIFVATAGRPYYLVGLYAPLAAAGALGFARRREHGTVRRWPVWLAVASSTGLAVGALALSVNITRSDVGEQIADRTAETFHALPVDQQQRTAIVGESYIVAAYLDGYSERFGLPEAHSLSRSYGYFTAPRPELDSMLYIGRGAASLRDYFDTSRQIADIGEDMHAFVLTGRRQSWESMWSHERTLTVS